MKMTADMWSQIYNLTPAAVPDWPNVDFYLIQRMDRSINYIGGIQITFTTGGVHVGNSTHYKGEAMDFAPASMSLWQCVQTLIALGWQRVGVRPSQGIVHADIGELDQTQNYSAPYYFFESASMADAGPLSAQSAATLASIPGYDPTMVADSIDVPVICGPNATVSVAQSTDAPVPDSSDQVQPDSSDSPYSVSTSGGGSSGPSLANFIIGAIAFFGLVSRIL